MKSYICISNTINIISLSLSLSLSLNCKAREFLYFKIYGKQCVTPVTIMTSAAKNNHEHITSLCERHEWFGRGRSSFQLFEQVYMKTMGMKLLLLCDNIWLSSGFYEYSCALIDLICPFPASYSSCKCRRW